MKKLHCSNVHNIENDGIIQLCEYSKRPPGHMVFVGIEKIGHSKSKAFGQRFL
jgi:hypothetical protein